MDNNVIMKSIKHSIFALFAALTLAACNSKSPLEFSAFTKQYFDDKNALFPLDATQYGQNQYNDQLLFEMTDSYRKKLGEFYASYENKLQQFDLKSLSEEEQNSYEIIKWEVAVGKEVLQQPTNLMPIHQFNGTHLTMGQFAGGTSAQSFATEKDYRNFLVRMEKFAVWIDSAMVYMKKGMAQNVVLPKALSQKVIPQFQDLITANPTDNLYYSAIKQMPNTIPAAKQKELASAYAQVISQKLVPQFQKMVAFLQTDYLPASRNTSGIGSLPFGKKLYAAYAKQWTTTTLDPETTHQLGLKEVARLQAEMEVVKKQVGYTGSLKEFMNEVRTSPKLKPFTTPEQVLANFDRIYQKIKPNVDRLFAVQPKTKFEIRRTEAFRENSASAEYVQGTADGSRPGIFYVPIPDAKEYNVLEDEDLFLHEAIPGHHFQVSLQQESTTLPDFRKFNWFGAYGEGWALYTESLGKELGLYQDPYQYLGMLNDEMHRAIRLVVDTGIHCKGWTREEAIAYSMNNEAGGEASITAEIERYMAIPGQALSYKIGQLKILELRHKAEAKLGKQFDIKIFHEKVLESGVMPLALLESKMNAWIDSVK
jgi:uncharacterized protein (DUF885 family)